MADMTLAQLQALVERQGAELAKLKAAAAATTPAPTEYYTLTKTGEEIDEILAGGGGGGVADAVRYGEAQSLTDTQKKQARTNINAASGGFGWGEESPQLVSTAAGVDAITANSVVRYANDLTNLVDGDSGSYTRYAIVVTYTVNATDKAQDVYCYGGGAHGDVMLHRGRSGNTWLPWEWVNPPMLTGVEYRTTERYWKKPVYTQVINCGSMPDIGSSKNVSIAAFNVAVVTFISGWCSYYASMFDETLLGMTMTANNSNIVIKNLNREVNSNAVMYALVKYTKTTD